MRLAMIIACTAALTACTDEPAPAAPERGTAAGEVLGGEVSDAMLPLETARSTSPAGSSMPDEGAGEDGQGEDGSGEDGAGEEGRGGKTTTSAPARPRASSGASPTVRPSLEAAPLPDMTMPADPEPLRASPDQRR